MASSVVTVSVAQAPVPSAPTAVLSSQNSLLLQNLMAYYKRGDNLDRMLLIINGDAHISLRIVDWFTTNYAKMEYTVYDLPGSGKRFKVYVDYKLKLRSYSKKNFDPFCRWDRINVPYKNDHTFIQTTIGQMNFFKWAFENDVIAYIEKHYAAIEKDMNSRNSTSKRKVVPDNTSCTIAGALSSTPATSSGGKTRKKREELSISASKTIKKEEVEIVVKFD
jgi:hypothetical protein